MAANWIKDAPRGKGALPQDRENLVYRALETALGPQAGLHVELKKRVPMGAGLGGGSSNAGTLLAELVREELLESAQAEKIALGLGADVPFFLDPRPSWVEGIGERRVALRVAKPVRDRLSFLLILPPRSTPTPVLFAKYRALRVPFARKTTLPTQRALDWKTLKAYLNRAENSLQGVAALEYPLLQDILSALEKTQPLHAALSGTGSTCFAVYPRLEAAQQAAKDLQAFCRKEDCRSIVARTHWGEQHGNHRSEGISRKRR